MATTICYPPGTDWSCSYTEEQLTEMRADPVIAAKMERSEALAWMQLAALTADQLGTCPITVRPCTRACLDHHVYLTASTRGGPFHPHINSQGNWVNSCGCAAGDCSCTALSEVILPGPVGDVLEILLDGAVLDPTAYRIDNGNRLVRLDGGVWPACQNMAGPAAPVYEPIIEDYPSAKLTWQREGDEVTLTIEGRDGIYGGTPGYVPAPYKSVMQFSMGLGNGSFTMNSGSQYTFSLTPSGSAKTTQVVYRTPDAAAPNDALGTFEVTYYQGAAPDPLSLWMAGLLAVEYFKACTSDKSCRLPNRLQSVARQGVTYNVAFEDDGTTGIREVDDYVRRLNPYHLKMPPVIVSPQSRRTRQTTWSR